VAWPQGQMSVSGRYRGSLSDPLQSLVISAWRVRDVQMKWWRTLVIGQPQDSSQEPRS
jgi:hypothetical protein